jgi:hypothetical protein
MIKPGFLDKPGFLLGFCFDINILQSAEADFVCIVATSIAEYQPILYFRRLCCLKK